MDLCLHCGRPIEWKETTFSDTGWMWLHRQKSILTGRITYVVQCWTGNGPTAEPTPDEQVTI